MTPGSNPELTPSLLAPTKAEAAYEVKFLVGQAQTETARAWAREHLRVDPYAEPALGDAYRIHSVYFDTDRLDVFNQAPSYKRRKYRLRRYGNEARIYAECKSKSGDRVSKRRTLLSPEELGRLWEPQADLATPAGWFHRRLLARQLRPRCVIGYERAAYVGAGPSGPVRLTLDRHIQCALSDGLDMSVLRPGIPLLADEVVLELKFRSAMPVLFKELIARMSLSPACISKYRLGMDAWGLAAKVKEVG